MGTRRFISGSHLSIQIRERSYITSSGLGGVGGPDTNDDIDDALREGWGGNHQNDDVIYEWVLSELPCNLSTCKHS